MCVYNRSLETTIVLRVGQKPKHWTWDKITASDLCERYHVHKKVSKGIFFHCLYTGENRNLYNALFAYRCRALQFLKGA